MRTVLEINEHDMAFAKGDILVFDGKEWKPVCKNDFLKSVNDKVVELQVIVDQLQNRLEKVEHELAYNRGEEEKL